MLDRFKSLCMLVLPLSLLCACGSSSVPGSLFHQRADAHQASAPAGKGGAALEADMVAGVSPGGGAPPIALKFRIAGRPVVGSPVQVALALIPSPSTPISRIHVSLQTGEGLQLQSQRSFDIEAPQGGVAVEEEVTVMPQQEGVLNLSATLVIDVESGSVGRTYSIPLIATNPVS
jgi:hypothetical protein